MFAACFGQVMIASCLQRGAAVGKETAEGIDISVELSLDQCPRPGLDNGINFMI